jgi:flagellar motor component MotA
MKGEFRTVPRMAMLGAVIGLAWGALSVASNTTYAYELGRLIADALIGAIAGAVVAKILPQSK